MKPNSSHDPSSDPDAALDEFFRLREMASDDFASRTLAAAKAKARRAQVIRFSAWTSAAAAGLVFLMGLNLWVPASRPAEVVSAPASTPTAPNPAGGETAPPLSSADELTLALHAAVSGQDAVFYGRALALEDLLEETAALTEEDNRETLDYLILLAGN